MTSAFGNLEKFRNLSKEVTSQAVLIEHCHQVATKIGDMTGDRSGTRLSHAELRESYQEIANQIQGVTSSHFYKI